jgi:hypothetical protein
MGVTGYLARLRERVGRDTLPAPAAAASSGIDCVLLGVAALIIIKDVVGQ